MNTNPSLSPLSTEFNSVDKTKVKENEKWEDAIIAVITGRKIGKIIPLANIQTLGPPLVNTMTKKKLKTATPLPTLAIIGGKKIKKLFKKVLTNGFACAIMNTEIKKGTEKNDYLLRHGWNYR